MNYYEILNLPKDASLDDIKTSYRHLVKLYHPDLNPNDPESVNKFRQVNAAYNTLKDPSTRRAYDESLSRGYSYEEAQRQGHYNRQQTYTQQGQYYDFQEVNWEDLFRQAGWQADFEKKYNYKEYYSSDEFKTKKANFSFLLKLLIIIGKFFAYPLLFISKFLKEAVTVIVDFTSRLASFIGGLALLLGLFLFFIFPPFAIMVLLIAGLIYLSKVVGYLIKIFISFIHKKLEIFINYY